MNESITGEDKNWAHTLFIDHPHLYLPILESLNERSSAEVEGLIKIFDQFKIPSSGKVLDLFCGIGRHSINLVKRGYDIVGYDPSPFFIERANKWADQELDSTRHKVRFYEGKPNTFKSVLRENNESGFDAIIIMFNSIGIQPEKDDLKLLQDLLTLGNTGCILILEMENRDWRIRHPSDYFTYDFESVLINERWEFDLDTSTASSRSSFYEKYNKGKSLRLQLELRMNLRLYSLHELKQLTKKAGWYYLESYGDLKQLAPVTLESENIVTISEKR